MLTRKRSTISRRRKVRPVTRAKGSQAPVWEELLRISKAIPARDLHKLPTDLAARHDHYLAGSDLS
jgi:hypothetical protein